MSGPLNPFGRRQPIFNPYLQLAAAAGGAAAREGLNYVGGAINNYFRGAPRQRPQQRPIYMGNVAAALPQQQRRGARRGGRGRGRGRQQPQISTGGGKISVTRGQESAATVVTTIGILEFNCSIDNLPRLKAMASAYERYRIKKVTVKYCSGSGQSTTGAVAIGYHPGPKNASVKDQDTILKLSPNRFTPGWKDTTLVIGPGIDAQRWMHVGKTTEEGVAFTLYYMSSGAATGRIILDYDIELAYPVPF